LGDINIALFDITIDGLRFGLLDASEPDLDTPRVHLEPNDLASFPPWDGQYDT
jgi:hypothetical protein